MQDAAPKTPPMEQDGGRLMTQIVEVIINWPNLTEQYSLNLHGFWQKRVADLRVET